MFPLQCIGIQTEMLLIFFFSRILKSFCSGKRQKRLNPPVELWEESMFVHNTIHSTSVGLELKEPPPMKNETPTVHQNFRNSFSRNVSQNRGNIIQVNQHSSFTWFTVQFIHPVIWLKWILRKLSVFEGDPGVLQMIAWLSRVARVWLFLLHCLWPL